MRKGAIKAPFLILDLYIIIQQTEFVRGIPC
jgi:hypothetical protein